MAFRSAFLPAMLAVVLPGAAPAQVVLVEDFEWPFQAFRADLC